MKTRLTESMNSVNSRSGFRGSTEELVIGLDIAKRKHHAFFGNGNGQTVLKGLIVENSAEGFRHLLSQVGFYMQRDDFRRVVFGLEPTSVYHKPLAEHLIEQGYLVVYATNEAIKKNRSLMDGRWDKNDTKDSANVADLVAQGKCQYYDLPELRLRELRNLWTRSLYTHALPPNDCIPDAPYAAASSACPCHP